MAYFDNNSCISNNFTDINSLDNYQNVVKTETNENKSKTYNKNRKKNHLMKIEKIIIILIK